VALLGGVEVLAAADETREDPRHEGAQGALVQRIGRHGDQSCLGASDMTSRTSIHS
jgi:hypothetical protein